MKLLKIKCTAVIIIALVSLFSFKASAQQEHSPLFMQRTFWYYNFYAGSNQITEREFRNQLKINPEAYKMYKNGKILEITGGVIAIAGATMVGCDLGAKTSSGNEGNDVVLAIGGAVWLGGLIVSFVGAKKRLKAFQLYNQKNTGFVELSLNGTGASLAWNF